MPAIVTHHIFGEEASRAHDSRQDDQEVLLSFLLGSQGATPLVHAMGPGSATRRACHELGRLMGGMSGTCDDGRLVEAIFVAREAARRLPADDTTCGDAFACGLAAHYLLEHDTQPFIRAQVGDLVDVDESLELLEPEVAALIEADLDSWVLWEARQLAIDETTVATHLARTDRVERIGGVILSAVASEVYGIDLRPKDYEASLVWTERVYAYVDQAHPKAPGLAHRVADTVHPNPKIWSLSHRGSSGENCAAANPDCHEWFDACIDTVRHESFGDLFYLALERWPKVKDAFAAGDRDRFGQAVAAVVPLS